MKLGWVDYSKEEKDIIKELLSKLGEEGALDELGVGIVRDSISDLLYPGTSVLLTRAKYYILIPELFDKAKRSTSMSINDIKIDIAYYKLFINSIAKHSHTLEDEIKQRFLLVTR